jgi:putative tryptophan/tyrosine transport system substrate-binding protein
MFSGAEEAASALGMQLQLAQVRSLSELDGAVAALTKNGVGAVFYPGSTWQGVHRRQIAESAVNRRLPTMCSARLYVEAGCRMTYAANFEDLWRRAAYFADRIMKGADPAVLPIEQPTKFEFVINMKTARILALKIPPSITLRADQLIE